ncbi:ornithine cyclodeaminase [Bordetella sp. BOR01]|uniref:ornithine cyclodeaminase n=1 Tax=Bordetella sp. BOR01 TaxID=2854779 RepID=UPI001C443FC0|nr:ornithine cyclodeaminase [Bordetella sp. BOR01]MBV7481400.1 ornithine cyclodeaminase [Bordetella sp. BOR01]
MTLLLTPPDVASLVRRRTLPGFLGQLEQAIREDFLRWPEFDKSARLAAHSPNGVIELMPAADDLLYSFKYVNGHPKNPHSGIPTVMAFGALAEVATGKPLLISELTLTTALRTAATSVMAARALARQGARSMALIGNGAQSEFQALAFHHLLGISEIRAYDIDSAATRKLIHNLADVPGLKVTAAGSTIQAVRGADIVTTVTADKAYATILTPDMIKPGMHLNAVGGDCPGKTELHRDILAASSTFVEFEPQSRIEGDIQQMDADFPVTELWRVLRGVAAGRASDTEVTVFDSVGFAMEDYSALRLLYAEASRLGLGQEVALIPALQDPRNLYSTLLAQDSRVPASLRAA